MINQKNPLFSFGLPGPAASRVPSVPRVMSLICLMAIFLASCSQVRDLPVESQNVDLSGMYPHGQKWRGEHMLYYARVAARSEPHNDACLGCHETKPRGRALNISCGATCHDKRPARFSRGPGPAIEVAQNECFECHAEKFETKYSHHPVTLGLCNGCHEVAPNHLSGAEPKAVKTVFSQDSCYSCHDRKDNEKHVHAALGTAVDCSNCHDPHGSKRGFFIRKEASDLCLKCHQNVVSGASQHDAAVSGEGCLECHVPHSGPREKLLNSDPDAKCFSCHSEMVNEFTRASVHAAMSEGCNTCHSPHASDHQKLLKGSYPVSEHLPFPGAEGFSLCFNCHDPGLLDPSGAGSTGFRDGSKNLHWIHIANVGGTTGPNWGRSCRICHEPHAADQARLIKNKLGKYGVPMVFQSFVNGGQCAASCHMPKSYFR